jgi:hypothetical protein
VGPAGELEPRADEAAPQLRIFVNYRRDDTAADALLLYERLIERFGEENVFLDARSLGPGMKWLEEIKSHGDACGVFLALIGRQWQSSMKAREQDAVARPAEDYVRLEIEYALRRSARVRVIPVLVGNAVPPMADRLPHSLQPLAMIQVEQLRYERLQADTDHLLDRLEEIAREEPAPEAEELPVEPVLPPVVNRVAPLPDAAHYNLVLQHMVDEGNLVPVLGSRINGGRSHERSGLYPDSEALAEDLAERFDLKTKPVDLAEVAQYVYTTTGRPDLYRTLKQILTAECEPGPVHHFLARFPGMLENLGLEKRYQLIVSTNFDNALERAFEEADEPYDLAVYMASGPDKGRFVHFPFGGEPEPIVLPNAYGKLPIGDYGELERTLIVKIHGAVDGGLGSYRWKENYVITEDHYIDYLSKSPVETLVPVQLLQKLNDSHCLFLGYTMRDWNLRVFLKRIWKGEPLGANSWAIERDPDVLEKKFWAQSYVELYASELAEYVDQLRAQIAARRPARAQP